MANYTGHQAGCRPDALKNRSFVIGLESPDLLKKYAKNGIDYAREKYEQIKTSDMPDFSELEVRVQQKERAGSSEGLHFGLSSCPDIMACWNSFSEEQKNHPYYRGYFWHVLQDLVTYAKQDIDAKFQKVLDENEGNPNIVEIKKAEVKKLHADWDKVNRPIMDTYPDVTITPEVKELGVVQFTEGSLVYIDWVELKKTFDWLRTFDPLNGNMEEIIATVMTEIKNVML